MTILPVPRDQVTLFEAPGFTPSACRQLLAFYKAYQEKNWLLFLSLRDEWQAQNPGILADALCANIHPMSGEFRPMAEQRIWCWGDGRALNIWSYSLLSHRVPDKTVTLRSGKAVNMLRSLRDYCDALYRGSRKRYLDNQGSLPVGADPKTGLSDNHPWNPVPGKNTKTYSNLFSASGWALYGMLSDNPDAVRFALEEFDAVLSTIENNTFSIGMTTPAPGVRVHGPRMIALGVAGEILKGISICEAQGNSRYSGLKEELVKRCARLLEYILDGNYRSDPPAFWEKSTLEGNPLVVDGICPVDPGHASEFAGFASETVPFLPETWGHPRWNKKTVLQAALDCHLFADKVGFSPKGVMYKAVDLFTGKPLPDTQAIGAAGRLTAPWWNVREHCAAALRLYTLTRDPRLVESYRKGQHASYSAYLNGRIMDQMIQTINPDTLEPMDIAPATGNMDAMHDPRSRIREMENLELLMA